MSFEETVQQARELILHSKRPYILFDDDPDGLASFLLIYRMIKEGKGSPIKGNMLHEEYAQKINEYSPDIVLILDKAVVDQEFLDAVNAPKIWIDHHDDVNAKGVLYVNPVRFGMQMPTSAICYEISQEDEWIAAVGTIADWQLPPKRIIESLKDRFPSLQNKKAQELLFDSPLGTLARVFSFNLKGKTKDVMNSIKILTRIKDPLELLKKKHPQAKLIMKKYEQHLKEYQELLVQAQEHQEENLLLFTYGEHQNSFTPDLSNELLYLYPTKTIFIARESSGSYKCSIRNSQISIKNVLEETIDKIGGQGGGHEHACGAIIPSEIFSDFIRIFREKLKRNALK